LIFFFRDEGVKIIRKTDLDFGVKTVYVSEQSGTGERKREREREREKERSPFGSCHILVK